MTNDELLKFYERQYGPFVHMAVGDKAIWLRYLLQGGAQFAPFAYDLRVGDGVSMPSGTSQMTSGIAYALTTKRIDVLYFFNGTAVIVEVKNHAGLSAIGQLIGYRDLYVRDYPDQPRPQMLLVTDRLQPDMVHVLTENGINYVEVGL